VTVKNSPANFIGVSPVNNAVRAELEHAARSDANVLITGESGVGKEVASRVIHQLSRRAHMPLVAINCAGIPESLLESELFGHVRGSVPGADRDRMGLLERAHRGTLVLDGACEMSARVQGLLLQFLETRAIQPVGSSGPSLEADVRIIATTNRDPFESVQSNAFCADLYYRLNMFHIVIPPLRERREDIPVLFDHFLRTFSAQRSTAPPVLSPDALEWITAFDWPGNVRQLRKTAERALMPGRGSVLTVDQLTNRRAPVATAKYAAV
jgi:DNA-binding NtrC family response regulator